MSPDVIAAFLTGVASIVGGSYTIRRARNQEREACDRRINELRDTYERGLDRGLTMSERKPFVEFD